MSYSLWLCPPAGSACAREAAAAIGALSRRLGGARCPTFAPHVTLLGGFPSESDDAALSATRTLCQGLGSADGPAFWGLEIELDAPEAGATHFQCVYMRVKTPNSALAKANALAQKALMHVTGDEGDGGGALELAPYLPHLSLVYGGTLEQAERAAIVDELRGGATDATPTVRAPTEGFVANEVSLWYTPVKDQSTASWREVAKVRMEGVDGG